MRKNSQLSHRRALEIIAASPQNFIDGLDHPVDISLEITLPENGKIITETDIRLVMANGDLHIIEYKSNRNHRTRARRQLEVAKAWYRRHTEISPDHIYTHTIFGDDPRYKNLLR